MQDFFDKANTAKICSSHTYERKAIIQANLDEIINTIEKYIREEGSSYVKFGFEQAGRNTENMWVEVTEVDHKGKTLTGKVANVPQSLTNVAYQDVVTHSFDDIIDITTNGE